MKDGGWEGVTATVKKCVCTRVWCSPEILLGIRITLLSPLPPPAPPLSPSQIRLGKPHGKNSPPTHICTYAHKHTHKTHTQAKHTNTYANARTKLPVSCSLATLSLSFQNTHCHIQLRLAGSHSSRRYTGTFEKENSPALSLSSLSLSLSLSLHPLLSYIYLLSSWRMSSGTTRAEQKAALCLKHCFSAVVLSRSAE